MQLIVLVLSSLPAFAAVTTDYATCDGDVTKLCFVGDPPATNCDSYFTGALCQVPPPGPPAPGAAGCCEGGTADATTTTTVATTTAGSARGSCVDKVNPTTGVSDCPRSAYLCKDNVYRNFMTVQCPKTCGYCSGSGTSGTGTGTSSTGCFDRLNPTTGVSDCPNRRNYCTNAVYRPLMEQQCPLTCGFCTSG